MKRYALMLAVLLMPGAASAERVRTLEGETWVYPYVLSAYSSGASVTVSVNTAAPPVVATSQSFMMTTVRDEPRRCEAQTYGTVRVHRC